MTIYWTPTIHRREIAGDQDDWRAIADPDWADEFCRRHGFDCNEVMSITYDVVDCPMLTFKVFKMPRGKVAVEYSRDVALRGELPAWWTPNVREGGS